MLINASLQLLISGIAILWMISDANERLTKFAFAVIPVSFYSQLVFGVSFLLFALRQGTQPRPASNASDTV